MSSDWKYFGAAATGTVLCALVAGTVAGAITGTVTAAPAGDPLAPVLIAGVTSVALAPLYVSRPRSVPSILRRTGKQVGLACLVLVGLGGLGVPGAPAVSTTLLAGGLLVLVLPAVYNGCRRRTTPYRVLVVGDDPVLLKSAIHSLPTTPVGFLSPVLTERGIDVTQPAGSSEREAATAERQPIATDGGAPISSRVELIAGVDRISGLSRLGHVIRERDIDTVALAFEHADRQECFGALRTCREHGVDALIHDSLTDRILETDQRVGDSLVRVDLEPWPWYSRFAKRAFDLVFATVGLLVLSPVIALLAVAIKLDSPGPVLYNQTRTSTLGGTFTVAKFRSMVTDAEKDGARLSEEDAGGVDPRVTDIGQVLRQTHLDEIPQLFFILAGQMSVVGPRPERPELDREIETDGIHWSKRWFAKPGLTGPAQINDVTGFEPATKLEYDLEYIQNQSFWFDSTLVARQIWSVVNDVVELIARRLSTDIDDDSHST